MKGKNNKKKVAAVSASLALLTLLSGTFAWTSYTEWVKNHLQSRGYEEGRVTVVEEFDKKTPIDEAVDGKINKKVNIVNTSSSDAFVRISFEEMLQKLAGGAAGGGYSSVANAQFPVIINDSEYRTAGGYSDKTTSLRIYDTEGGTLQDNGALKLYVSADESSAILVNEYVFATGKNGLPQDFDVTKEGSSIPVISGDWSAATTVAQKVTGAVVKQTDGTWAAYTSKYTGADADKNVQYWGYGVQLDSVKEFDWAGANYNVSVASTPAAATLKQSGIAGSGIKFTQDNIVTTIPTAGTNENKWYYNSADGYFYYTGVLAAGSTTSSSVIEQIEFPLATADQTYKVASYNLYIGLESIPATQAAITTDSDFGAITTPTHEGDKTYEVNGKGWGLGTAGRGATGANDTALITYYKSIATIVE